MPYFFKIFRALMLPGSHVYRRARRAGNSHQEGQQPPLPAIQQQQEQQETSQAPSVVSEPPRVPRSQADKQRREDYARRKKTRLVQLGVLSPTVEHEHRCGCPVYSEHKGKRKCAFCESPNWGQDAMQLLRDIMEQ